MHTRIPCLLALLAAPTVAAQAPCTGWSLDNEVQAYGVAGNGIGVGDELIASYHVLDPVSSLGGVSIHRVLPDGTGVTLEDSFAQSGIGPGFAAFVFGCAISNDGAVLLARKRPAPLPVDLIQFRRVGSVWSASSFPATGVSTSQKSRHFHSDGNTAVVAATSTGSSSSRIVVDFLTVDAVTGDWMVEDTARGPFAAFGYAIGDVTVGGDQAVVQVLGSRRALAWERTAPGSWTEVALPAALVDPSSDMLRLALEDDVLASLHGTSSAPRIEIRERGPQGGWSLMSMTPVPSISLVSGGAFHMARDRVSLQVASGRVSVFHRSSPTALVLESGFNGIVSRLEEDFAVAAVFDFPRVEVNVLPLDELASGLSPCFSAGRNVCTGQRGGALRYLPEFASGTDALLLTEAPPNSLVVLIGQRNYFEPVQPTLGGLCLSNSSSGRVTVPPIRTALDGSGLWRLDPTNLMGTFGPVSYAGSLAAFQGLVRTPAGTVSTDAVWVQL